MNGGRGGDRKKEGGWRRGEGRGEGMGWERVRGGRQGEGRKGNAVRESLDRGVGTEPAEYGQEGQARRLGCESAKDMAPASRLISRR